MNEKNEKIFGKKFFGVLSKKKQKLCIFVKKREQKTQKCFRFLTKCQKTFFQKFFHFFHSNFENFSVELNGIQKLIFIIVTYQNDQQNGASRMVYKLLCETQK